MPVDYRTVVSAARAAFRTRSLLFAAVFALGCSGSTDPVPQPKERVASIISNISQALFGDETLQAEAYAVGAAGDSIPGLTISIRALTSGLATISSTGVIQVRGTGFALFLASTTGFADTIGLPVFASRVARVTATPDSVALVVGDSLDVGDVNTPFVVHTFDASGNEMLDVPIFVSSSDEGVVTARSYYYEIIARAAGTTVLTLTADTSSTAVQVTVTAKP